MVNFPALARTAQRLIEANGRPVTIFKMNRTPDNPAAPWDGVSGAPTPGDGESMDAIMAFVPATGSGFGKLVSDAGGSTSVVFDQVGLLATESLPDGTIVPKDVEQADSIRDGDDIWKIVTRGHLQPGVESILFVLGLKR